MHEGLTVLEENEEAVFEMLSHIGQAFHRDRMENRSMYSVVKEGVTNFKHAIQSMLDERQQRKDAGESSVGKHLEERGKTVTERSHLQEWYLGKYGEFLQERLAADEIHNADKKNNVEETPQEDLRDRLRLHST